MGFGILLFGYFALFAFSISPYYFFADIIGAFIVIKAYSKLAEYNKYFIKAMVAALGLMIPQAIAAASLMFDWYTAGETLAILVDVCKNVFSCLMHVFMFLGIRGIACGADCETIQKKAERNLALTMAYYVFYALVLLFHPLLSEYVQMVSGFVEVYSMICIVLNLVLLYRCFAVLCSADEDENEKKRSRFAFINKINDKYDELEFKRNEYTRESMQMALDEAGKRAAAKNKKNNKNKKKKRK